MGYTHYYRQSRDFTDAEWTEFTERATLLIKAAPCRLAGPHGEAGTAPKVSDEWVAFNGVGSAAHETAYIERYASDRGGPNPGFGFCKTNHKPYDLTVRRLYRLARDVTGDAFELSSDGGDDVFDVMIP